MKNNFKDEDKSLFDPVCQECGSNNCVSIHHLYGRKRNGADSIINATPLCIDCHSKADGKNTDGIKGHPFRIKHLEINLRRVLYDWQYSLKDRDYLFCESIKKDIELIHRKLHE